jgi:hypothetical protein
VERGVAIGRGELVLFDELREAVLDRRARPLEHRLGDVDEVTENPDWANTWAMPLPIVPAPITPTVLISINVLSRRHEAYEAYEDHEEIVCTNRSSCSSWFFVAS